jgi:hypothetical protein
MRSAPPAHDCETTSYRSGEIVQGETCADLGYSVECNGHFGLHDCSGHAEAGDRVAGFPEGVGFDPDNPNQPDGGANGGAAGVSPDGGTGIGGAGGSGGAAGNDVDNHISPVGNVTAESGMLAPRVLAKLHVSDTGNCAVFLSTDDWTAVTTEGEQIFLADLDTGDTEMVSVDSAGNPDPDRWASFYHGVVDLDGLVTTADCDKVVFTGGLLDPAVNADSSNHAYVRDRVAGTTTALDGPLAPGGVSADSVSITPDGTRVAYIMYDETALLDLFGVQIIQPGEIFTAPLESLSEPAWFDPVSPRIMTEFADYPLTIAAGGATFVRDGSHLLFVSASLLGLGLGEGSRPTVLMGDLQNASFEVVSNQAGGEPLANVEFEASASGDGRYVTFKVTSTAADGPPAGLYLRDMEADTLTLITKDLDGEPIPANFVAEDVQVTGDGRYVIFSFINTALVGEPDFGRSQIYRYDIEQDTIQLITRGLDGLPSDMNCQYPGANYDGTVIAFSCDTNDVQSNLTTVTAPEFGNLGGIFVYREP